MGQNGLKVGANILVEQPKWANIIFGKTHISPIFDTTFVTKWPIFKVLWDFKGAKMAQNGLKMFHLIVHPKWSMITSGENTFLTRF